MVGKFIVLNMVTIGELNREGTSVVQNVKDTLGDSNEVITILNVV